MQPEQKADGPRAYKEDEVPRWYMPDGWRLLSVNQARALAQAGADVRGWYFTDYPYMSSDSLWEDLTSNKRVHMGWEATPRLQSGEALSRGLCLFVQVE